MSFNQHQPDILEDWPGSDYFQIEYEASIATLWVTLATSPKPCLRRQLIEDFNALAAAIRSELGRSAPSPKQPLKFVVLRSNSDKVFNLGGDLDHFVEAITAGSGDMLRHYGRLGAIGCLALATGFDASIVTISLVRGIAVGGGFEVARCCNLMVAEADAVFQLPEADFGLFPASGIMSIVAPRIGPRATRNLVIGCQRMDTAQALAADVLDEVAPVGGGEAQVRALIARLTPRHAAAVATFAGLNRMAGITLDALVAEADLWARAALNLSADNLSTMRRLSKAQARRFKAPPSVPQISLPTDHLAVLAKGIPACL